MPSVKEFLDLIGLTTLLNQLKNIFASKKAADNLTTTTDPLILNIDYTNLEFDKDEIIKADESVSNNAQAS